MATHGRSIPPDHTTSVGPTRAYTQLLITVVIWGGYFVVAKKAVGEASPLALSTARYAVGVVLLGALAASRGPLPRPTRKEFLVLAAMGVTSVFGFNVLSFIGFNLAPASDGALIMPTVPTLFTLPAAALLFAERFGRWQYAGLGLLVTGEFLVFRVALFSNELSGDRLAGIGLFFAAACLWALYTICARYLGGRIGPIHATFYAVLIGTAVLLPFGGLSFVRMIGSGPSPGLVGAIVYLGLLQTVVGLVWWFQGVQAIGASRAAVLNTLVPVVALFLAAVVLDDIPSVERLAGAALVVGGVAVAASRRTGLIIAQGE